VRRVVVPVPYVIFAPLKGHNFFYTLPREQILYMPFFCARAPTACCMRACVRAIVCACVLCVSG
jgi:hypothetical protein